MVKVLNKYICIRYKNNFVYKRRKFFLEKILLLKWKGDFKSNYNLVKIKKKYWGKYCVIYNVMFIELRRFGFVLKFKIVWFIYVFIECYNKCFNYLF